MAALVYLGEGSQVHGRDSNFTEVISQRMRVPERLGVGHGIVPDERSQNSEDPHPVYSMHVPDRLALTDAPDLSPRPLFSKQGGAVQPSSTWDPQHVPRYREACAQEPVQSPLRRSYSDQAFGRTPPGTPTHPPQALPSPLHGVGRAVPAWASPAAPPSPPAVPQSLLSPQSVLQVAKQLGQQASQRILHTVTQKYSSRFTSPEGPSPQQVEVHSERAQKSAVQESCFSPEGDAGTAVEFIVLRRQVVKMSRRIVALERQNAERRQTELALFSLLVSACLLNGWLWMRR